MSKNLEPIHQEIKVTVRPDIDTGKIAQIRGLFGVDAANAPARARAHMAAAANDQAVSFQAKFDNGVTTKYTAMSPTQIQNYAQSVRERVRASGLGPAQYTSAFTEMEKLHKAPLLPHERNEQLQNAALQLGTRVERDIATHNSNLKTRRRVATDVRRGAALWDIHQQKRKLQSAGLENTTASAALDAAEVDVGAADMQDPANVASAKESTRRAKLGVTSALAHRRRGIREAGGIEALEAHGVQIKSAQDKVHEQLQRATAAKPAVGTEGHGLVQQLQRSRDALEGFFRAAEKGLLELKGLAGGNVTDQHRFDQTQKKVLSQRGEIKKVERETAEIKDELTAQATEATASHGRGVRLSTAFTAHSIGGRANALGGALMGSNGDTFGGTLMGSGATAITGSMKDYSMNRFMTAETKLGQRGWGLAMGASMGLELIAAVITAGVTKGLEIQRTVTDKRTGEAQGYLSSLGGISGGQGGMGYATSIDIERADGVDEGRAMLRSAERRAFERYNRGGLVSKTESLQAMSSLAGAGLSGGAFARAMGAKDSFGSKYDMMARVAYHNVGVSKRTGFDVGVLSKLSQLQAGGLGERMLEMVGGQAISAGDKLGGLVQHGFATRGGAQALMAQWIQGGEDNYTAHSSDADFLGNMGRRGIDPERTGKAMSFLGKARHEAGALFGDTAGLMAKQMVMLHAAQHVENPIDLSGYIRGMSLSDTNQAIQASGPQVYDFIAKNGMNLGSSDVAKVRGADGAFVKDAGLETDNPFLLFSSALTNRGEIRKDGNALDAEGERDAARINEKLEMVADALADIARTLGALFL